MTQIQSQNTEYDIKAQMEELVRRSISEKRTIVIVIRWRESIGYYNYQTKRVIIFKPNLRWEEEEAPAMLVDIPISVFDNPSYLADVDDAIKELKEKYSEDVDIEMVMLW